jgi:NAD+ synthase (glutamine-hydrolysing)
LKLVTVAAAALNQTPLDWNRNRDNIVRAIERARAEGVGLLCLPELCITGYGCEDAFLSPHVRETALDVLQEILPSTTGLAVNLGLPLSHNRGIYNVSCLVASAKVLGFVAKRALAGDGIHYEPRWFKAWPAGRRARTSVRGVEYPIGDLVFDLAGVRVGFEICEDAWTAERPGAELSREAVDVILNPSASHFAFGKREVRERLVLEGSRAFGVTYVYANLLGNEAGRAIYDGDTLIASGGQLVARSRRFSFSDFELASAVVDLELGATQKSWVAAHATHVSVEEGSEVHADFALPRAKPVPSRVAPETWESSPELKHEEFARALSLGLFDYLRKSRSKGFVVSLSGGADSALVACLVWLMARLALGELGPAALAAKLGIPSLAGATTPEAVVHALLTTAYQSTEHSSETTRAAARAVADAIGSRHFELDVTELVHAYVSRAEHAIGRKLEWSRDDLSLQNVQARVRAPSVWLLANIESALLLATSNRSEAAVGYATMDGDTAGGLSPIAGIDKRFVRKFLSWLETQGPSGLGAIPALRAVNVQAPTAELRPKESVQTDEADLMPYDLLDAIERSAIRDKRSPRETWLVVRAEFPQYGAEELLTYLTRFFRLFSRNQWKRERYAPSFHVDDESLDPKTWCRFPILSGGFERELTELEREVRAEILAQSAAPS